MAKATVKRGVGRPPKSGDAAGTTRERMLQAGFEIAMASGLRGVTVGALTERADANAGSFVYHFGTREAFLGELVERWYMPFMSGLRQATAHASDPLERLRELLTTLALWAVHHGGFVSTLLADAAAGETVAQRFLAELPARHPTLILKAVRDCQAAGLIEAGPPWSVALFLMGAIALPTVFVSGVLRAGELLPASASSALRRSIDEAGTLQRLHWALKAVAVPPKAPARRLNRTKA